MLCVELCVWCGVCVCYLQASEVLPLAVGAAVSHPLSPSRALLPSARRATQADRVPPRPHPPRAAPQSKIAHRLWDVPGAEGGLRASSRCGVVWCGHRSKWNAVWPVRRHIVGGPMRVSSHANGGAGSARAPLLGLMALGKVIVLGCALHPLNLGTVQGRL